MASHERCASTLSAMIAVYNATVVAGLGFAGVAALPWRRPVSESGARLSPTVELLTATLIRIFCPCTRRELSCATAYVCSVSGWQATQACVRALLEGGASACTMLPVPVVDDRGAQVNYPVRYPILVS